MKTKLWSGLKPLWIKIKLALGVRDLLAIIFQVWECFKCAAVDGLKHPDIYWGQESWCSCSKWTCTITQRKSLLNYSFCWLSSLLLFAASSTPLACVSVWSKQSLWFESYKIMAAFGKKQKCCLLFNVFAFAEIDHVVRESCTSQT